MRYHTRSTLGDYADGTAPTGADPRSVRVVQIDDGPDSVRQTLRLMRALARNSLKSPTQVVRNTTLGTIAELPPRQWRAEINACQAFVRDYVRYAMDPDNIELVQTPDKTLELQAGDCDDKSTLLAAMLLSIGHPCRFLAVGFNHEPISHVLVEARCGEGWLPLETILPVAAGWYPPGVTSRYVLSA